MRWRDLYDWLPYRLVGHWFHDLDYGSVPAWVSAFAVPAALYIILRDRKASRAEQALQVAARVEWTEIRDIPGKKTEENHAVFYAYNGSPLPVHLISFVTRFSDKGYAKRHPDRVKKPIAVYNVPSFDENFIVRALPPGESLTHEFLFAPGLGGPDVKRESWMTDEYYLKWRTYFAFTDAQGTRWIRSCQPDARLEAAPKWLAKARSS